MSLSSPDSNQYRGIPIHAAPKLHEKCFEIFKTFGLKHDAKILILGAGSGAFDERLIDAGYKDMTAIDIEKSGYKSNNKNIFDYDLNDDFEKNFPEKSFDAVIAIEIIEHLYSPYDFLRKIKKVMKPEGHLLLSTPNPENSISRIKFFLSKKIHFFSDLDLDGSGHISPMFEHVLNYYLKILKFKIVKKTNNGLDFWFLPLKLKVAYLIFFIFTIYQKDNGYIHVYYIKN